MTANELLPHGTGKSHVPYRVRYGRTTVRNIPLGVPANHHTHTTNYNGKRIAPIAERAKATFLTVVLLWFFVKVSLLPLNLTIQLRDLVA